MLIIISGPPAAGKSSVAEALAKKFKKTVHFSKDTIYHFIKAGHIPPWIKGAQAKKQFNLNNSVIKEIIKKYTLGGYTVIVDGIFGDSDIKEYKTQYKQVKAFILLPSLKTLKKRDLLRDKKLRMLNRVNILHKSFSSAKNNYFEPIDNTNHNLKKTVDVIFRKVKGT